ncbi:MAG: nuclear transport factor 2 family protein [Hyphomicrobiaceae bacterium]
MAHCPSQIVRDFYAARASGNLDAVRTFIAPDVLWIEPAVGDQTGELHGADAVIDMITKALELTSGTFALEIGEIVEVAGHCAAVISWSAEKAGHAISSRELATFSVVKNRIAFAHFLPEDIEHDRTFWD